MSKLNSSILEEFVANCRKIKLLQGWSLQLLVLTTRRTLLLDLRLPNVAHSEEPKSIYDGCDYRYQGDSGKTHFALAFEASGGWRKEKEATVVAVLQEHIIAIYRRFMLRGTILSRQPCSMWMGQTPTDLTNSLFCRFEIMAIIRYMTEGCSDVLYDVRLDDVDSSTRSLMYFLVCLGHDYGEFAYISVSLTTTVVWYYLVL